MEPPSGNIKELAVLIDPSGCSAGVFHHIDDNAIGFGFAAADTDHYPDDPERSEAFARRCLWATTFHIAGFPFGTEFASEYGADLYPVSVAAVRAINACAQSPHPTRPIMTVEQLPDPGCVGRGVIENLRN